MSGSTALVLSNRSYPTPTVSSNFAKNLFDWETLSSVSSMPSGGSVSRAGNAMLYDSTGKLTYAPNNLLLQSNTFSNAAWVKNTGTSVTGQDATDPFGVSNNAWSVTIGSGGSGLHQQFSAINPTKLGAIWMRAKSGTAQVYIDWGGGSSTLCNLTTTWQQFSSVTTNTSRIYFVIRTDYPTNVGNASIEIYGATMSAVTYETSARAVDQVITTTAAYYGPRFDYDPVTLQPKGLLVEGARTNLLNFSQLFATSGGAQNNWDDTNITRNSTNNTSPDGTGNALRVTASAANGTIISSAAIGTSAQRVLSVWLRRVTGTGNIQYTLDNGTSWTTQAIASTWTRYSFSATTADQQVGFRIAISGDAIEIWGVQLEAGAFATSYVPTTTGTVSRAAETFTITGYANRLLEAYYIDQETGVSSSIPETVVSSGAVTINPPSFGWVTSLRAYTNAYAGDIASPSWLSFSRTGNAMYFDSTGTLTWAPANMVVRSNELATSPWAVLSTTAYNNTADTTAPDGTSTASKIVETTVNSSHGVYQSITGLQPGGSRILSAYIKKGTTRYVALFMWNSGGTAECGAAFDLNSLTATTGAIGAGYSAANASIVSAGNGWYRCSVVCGSPVSTDYPAFAQRNTAYTSGTFAESYIGSTANYTYVWGAQVEPVTYQTAPHAYIPTTSAAVYGPRYDYDASTVPATPRGLLIEESRANLLTYSNTFTGSGWTNSNANIAAGGVNGVDETTNTVSYTTTAASSYVGAFISQTAQAYSQSVYAKRGNNDWIAFGVSDGSNRYVWFNLSTGVKGSAIGSATGTIQSVGNGWYRLSVTYTPAAASNLTCVVIPVTGDGALTNSSGASVLLQQAQLEAGAFSTSLIPTTSASVTRAADVAQLTGSALTTAQSATGSVVAQTSKLLEAGGANHVIVGAYSGGYRYLLYSSFSNTQVSSASASTLSAIIGSSGTFTSGAVRGAFGWNASGSSIFANNGALQTSSSHIIPATAGSVYVGTSGSGEYLSGWIASLALYNTRLPDAILKQKSTVNAPY